MTRARPRRSSAALRTPGGTGPAGLRRRSSGLLLVVALLLSGTPAAAMVGDPVDLPTPAPDVRVVGGGWGHGVGLSQYGARAQALAGWGVDRILRYWYRGVDIATTADSSRQLVVGLSTAAVRPEVAVTEGVGQWQVCAASCTALLDDGGDRIRQRPADGTWTVVATRDGQLSLRDGATTRWQGTTASRLRLRLSTTDTERDVARVLGRRHRWGVIDLGAPTGADCLAPQLCVTVALPSTERYLRGLGEVPSSWPGAALGAQAVVGRTYALRMRARGLRQACRCHLLATPSDQVYVGLDKEEGASGDRWVARVDATRGRVVRHDGRLAATFYSSSHGGRSERLEDSYAFSAPSSAYPYLRSVDDPWSGTASAGNPYARWTTTVGNGALARFVDDRMVRVTGIAVRSRTRGGTPRELLVDGVDGSGAPMTVAFAGRDGKQVADRRVWIAGAELKQRFSLRSQQIRRLGLAPFTDDDGTTHEYRITTLAAAGVTEGCAADRYCPNETVSRAQTAALLARALQLTATDGDAFADDDASVHEGAIDATAAAGVVLGCGDGRFCPGRRLRRDQMASVLARALELPATDVDAFADDDGNVHEDNVDRLAAAGITTGVEDGRFAPRGSVTRGQFASFLVRALRG